MLGLSAWVWVVLGLLALLALLALRVLRFYKTFRAMCRSVRGELVEFLKVQYPEVEVVGERQGNLVLRTPERGELVWELADVYVDVARLPDGGRAAIYQRSAAALLGPPLADTGPLSRAAHGERIKPRLVRPEFPGQVTPDAALPQTPVAGLGLVAVYVLDSPGSDRYVAANDLDDLGLDVEGLHQLALGNLRKDFPRQLVADALAGKGGTAVHFHDSFDASRLLLVPECLQEKEELVALIPNRDLLLLFSATAAPDDDKLREGMRLLHADQPPLLDCPVRVTRAGFMVL